MTMTDERDQSPALTNPSPDGRGQGEGSRPAPDVDGKASSPSPHPNPLPSGEGTVRRPNRRRFLALIGAVGTLPALGLPRAVFAAAPTERRFVVVLLRGALDGLAAVPPLGERRYAELRGNLALPAIGESGGCLPLEGIFPLHPALAAIHPHYKSGEVLFVPAARNGYRTRSHFDAQDLMESGLGAKTGQSDGWLNRALAAMQPATGDRRLGIAVGGAVPLVLRRKA